MKKKPDNFKILVLVEFFSLTILFMGCFGEENLVGSFWGEDAFQLTAQTEADAEYESNRIELMPGVYCLKAQIDLASGQSVSIDVRAEQASYKALRNNAVTVLERNDGARFLVYVLDRIPKAYVHCTFTGADIDSLMRIDLYKTKLGSRMLLFLSTAVFFMLDFMLAFRRGVIEKKISGRQQIVFWTLTAGVLILFFPYLTDYITFGDDTIFYLERIAFLKDALQREGVFSICIQSTWAYGHGYAASLFCGGLFLYIPACLMLLGFSAMNAFKMFLLMVLTATAVIAYLCFKKCVKDEYAALFGSMIYLLMPYHLFNIYNRWAVGEYLAMTFFPMVCCGMYLLYTRDETSGEYRKYKCLIIWGMSAVLQSDLISTEMTTVLMAMVCIVFWKKTFQKQTFCQLAESVIMVLLLNVWFWVPLLYMMKADTYKLGAVMQGESRNYGTLIGNYFQIFSNNWSGHNGMQSVEPIHIGAGAFILLVFYSLWRLKHRREKSGICETLAVFSILLIVMSTQYIPWDVAIDLPGIGYIAAFLQFPYRWMAPAAVVASMFAAFLFKLFKERGGKLSKTVLAAVAVISVGTAIFYVNDYAANHAPVFLYNAESLETIGVIGEKYLPEGILPEK